MNEIPAPKDGVVTEILVSKWRNGWVRGKVGTYQMIDIQGIKEALPHRYPML